MGFKIKDQLEFSLFINRNEYPLEAFNALNFFHAAESTQYYLPTCHLGLIDKTKSMYHLLLSDGSQLGVGIRHTKQTQDLHFRVGNYTKHPSGSEDLFEIDGLLDAPRYTLGTALDAIPGTSNDALAQIAQTCNLNYSGVATNDSMLWMQRNMTYAQFASYIAQHGYMMTSSHMVHGVRLSGELVYRDVRAMKPRFQVTHGYSTTSALQATDFRPAVRSGINNSLGGYRSTRYGQSAYGTTVKSDLDFVPKARTLLVNTDVREIMQRGPVAYSPVDFGNVHAEFNTAMYQNARFDNLHSLGIELVFNMPTSLQLLEAFSFSSKEESASDYNGDYVIGHRTIFIQGSSYAEKVIAYREGTS